MLAEETFGVLAAGSALAVAFNPLTSIVATPLTAALLGGRDGSGPRRRAWAFVVLSAGWLLGDGLRVLGRARDVLDGTGGLLEAGAPLWAQYSTVALWGLGGLALGYVLPVCAGAFVGRRVTHGTGWAAAGMVAAGVAGGLATLAGSIAV